MKRYIIPETSVLAIQANAIICASVNMMTEKGIITPSSFSDGSNAN